MNIDHSLDTVVPLEIYTSEKEDKEIQQIIFTTVLYGIKQQITIDRNKLDKWRNKSDYINTLLNSYHDNNNIEIDVYKNVNIDMYALVSIFNYFDTGKIQRCPSHNQMILYGLAYFGIDSEELNSIKKGLGLVWKLTTIDNKIKNEEEVLKNNIISLIEKKKAYNKINTLEYKYDSQIVKDIDIELKNIDEEILLNKNKYNELYEYLYKNNPKDNKHYETHISYQKIHPEFDLSFIKQEFENKSHNVFDDIDNCIVTGGMVSKHFTYNNYFIDTDYDVYLITQDPKIAIDTIRLIYQRLNDKMKLYILKTKNTITFYNTKIEIQIITKLYHNISEVLTQFDLDSCCVAYNKGNFYALPRFVRSLAYSGNIFDPEKQSPSYIHRIKKYIKRGFSLFIPGLRKNDVNYNKDNYIIRKLREKTNGHERDSDYCDLFTNLNNRSYYTILDILENMHKENKYTDTYHLNNIEDVNENSIKWNIDKYTSDIDYYKDMYFCKHIL